MAQRSHAAGRAETATHGPGLLTASASWPFRHVHAGLLLGAIVVVFLSIAAIGTRAVGERNLLANGGFSSSLDGWRGWNARLTRQEQEGGAHGSALVTWSGVSRSYAVYTSPRPLSRLRAGATFVAAAELQSRSSPGRRVCLALREWTSTGALVATSRRCGRSSPRWQRFAVSHTVRRQGAQLEVVLVGGDPRPGDSFALDEVELELVPSARASSSGS